MVSAFVIYIASCLLASEPLSSIMWVQPRPAVESCRPNKCHFVLQDNSRDMRSSWSLPPATRRVDDVPNPTFVGSSFASIASMFCQLHQHFGQGNRSQLPWDTLLPWCWLLLATVQKCNRRCCPQLRRLLRHRCQCPHANPASQSLRATIHSVQAQPLSQHPWPFDVGALCWMAAHRIPIFLFSSSSAVTANRALIS